MFVLNRGSGRLLLRAALVVVSALALSLFSCAPAEGPVEVSADGALVIPSLDSEIRLRAYRPDPEFLLSWEQEGGGEVKVVLENITASTAVEVIPEEGEAAAYTVSSELPLSLVVTVEGDGRQRFRLSPQGKEAGEPPFFAVFGDSQGRNDVLEKIIEEINLAKVDFVICLGDLVASGTEEEYREFMETMAALECPYYPVMGNHDVRGEGAEHYCSYLAPAEYRFDYGGFRFLFTDSSRMGYSREQLSRLEEELTGALPTFLFLHVPPLDPREKDHAFLDPEEARAFVELISEPSRKVQAVFSGHIHMFHHRVFSGVHHIVSGGGGAALYASATEGGYHHFALCRLEAGELQVEPVKVEAPSRSGDLAVTGPSGDLVFTAAELAELAVLEQELEFQNRLENYRGQGFYRGVPVSVLLEEAGGMKPGDILMVHALDGYAQAYAYENVYPESCGWEERQGQMALAVEYEGMTLPEWAEGYRIAFFPEDGVYDNEDCALTSAEGQGWNIYESAGARWVKTVIRLEVVAK
ncbi:MAG: hypothetical protein GX883_08855 [Firmicutes bacterium]|nr:hypothetical protein [Bacillota bacterium]